MSGFVDHSNQAAQEAIKRTQEVAQNSLQTSEAIGFLSREANNAYENLERLCSLSDHLESISAKMKKTIKRLNLLNK